MLKNISLTKNVTLPRNSLAKNLNTKREKRDGDEKKKIVNMKQRAFLKMLPVLAGLHNTATPSDRLLPNITLGKKGEYDKYDPSTPFHGKTFPKIKTLHNKPLHNLQKTLNKQSKRKNKHRGGRKTIKNRKSKKY